VGDNTNNGAACSRNVVFRKTKMVNGELHVFVCVLCKITAPCISLIFLYKLGKDIWCGDAISVYTSGLGVFVVISSLGGAIIT